MHRARNYRHKRPFMPTGELATPITLGANARAFTFMPAGGRAIPANPIIDARAVCIQTWARLHTARLRCSQVPSSVHPSYLSYQHIWEPDGR